MLAATYGPNMRRTLKLSATETDVLGKGGGTKCDCLISAFAVSNGP
jgi:hypothetical protein